MDSILNTDLADRLADLYRRMEEEYDRVAGVLSFNCTGCPDNCCDSYFLHHTYVEWFYLWEGLASLDAGRRALIEERARQYVLQCEQALARQERPQLMCPLNDDGLCGLYGHRLMICRMHGVPSAMVRPDGRRFNFPGCFRCQEMVEAQQPEMAEKPEVDRTAFYRELVDLEHELLGPRRHYLPRAKLTIAEMIVKGPPEL